jgi:hypothetical protein
MKILQAFNHKVLHMYTMTWIIETKHFQNLFLWVCNACKICKIGPRKSANCHKRIQIRQANEKEDLEVSILKNVSWPKRESLKSKTVGSNPGRAFVRNYCNNSDVNFNEWKWDICIDLQGCQMTYFPIWVNFGGSCNEWCLYIVWPFDPFYGLLVYFVAIWYISWLFGIFFQFGYGAPKKLCQRFLKTQNMWMSIIFYRMAIKVWWMSNKFWWMSITF